MEVLLLGTGSADGWPNPWCECASCGWARTSGVVRSHTAALLDRTLLLDCGPDVPRQADRAGVGLASVRAVLLTHGHWDHTGPQALLARAWARRSEPLRLLGPARALDRCRDWIGPADPVETEVLAAGDVRDVDGHRVRVLAAAHGGGSDDVADEALLYDVTGPDGSRLLYATDTAALPAATLDAVAGRAYGLVLLDETFGTAADHGTGHLDLATFPLVLAQLRRRGAVTSDTDVVAVHLGHHNPPGADLDRHLAPWAARTVPDLTRLRVGGAARPRPAGPHRTLLLGGARSGKSRLAEQRLAAERAVTYVATGGARDGDAEWAARVGAHRARRPAGWTTLETTDAATVLRAAEPGAAVLVDCLALWLTAVLDAAEAWTAAPDARHGDLDRVSGAVADLVAAVRSTRARVVLVSNEVGSGIVPEHLSGRLFRDHLGELNAQVAAVCDEVALVVAGRELRL